MWFCRKKRMIGSGNNAREVGEYEINTALIESLNSVEKRTARASNFKRS